jgi:hypothetical protein
MNRFIRKRIRSTGSLCAAFLGAWLVALPHDAYAGLQSPCRDPMVLPGPKVQVFVLPYKAESRLTARGRELATIVQRHVLFAALKYRSIAVTEFTGDAEDCAFEQTAARVNARLKEGQAAIFLWGRLFEQGDSIRLQSTTAFGVRGVADTLSWKLGGADSNSARAAMPADPVAFPARAIPLYFLDTLESAQRASRRIHSAPNASSSFWELPADPDARFGYEVIETRADWMHVRLIPEGGDGWIPAHALATGEDLKGAFPELYFIDGLIGYHQLWNLPGTPAAADSRTLAGTRTSFDKYIELAAGRAESEGRAYAAIMKGNATLRSASTPWSTEVLVEAQRYYEAAQQLAPTSTVANNFFLACSAALCARGACSGSGDQLHHRFLVAVAQDPTSAELIGNLNAFYAAVEGGRISLNASREEIARQKAATERVQSAMQ